MCCLIRQRDNFSFKIWHKTYNGQEGRLKYQGVLQKLTTKYNDVIILTILMEYNLNDTHPLSDELTIKLLSSKMLALDKHRTGAV